MHKKFKKILKYILILNMKKILVLGDGGVGKTALINKLCNKQFTRRYISTYNVTKTIININNIQYEYIDTPGQNIKYSPETFINYLEDINEIWLIYSMTSKLSYNNIDYYKRFIPRKISYKIIGTHDDSKYKKCEDNNIVISNKLDTYITLCSKLNL